MPADFDARNLNDAEREVLRATALGRIAEFSGMPSVRGAFLRHLVLELPVDGASWPLTLAGVRIVGARIEGEDRGDGRRRIDLSDCAAPDGKGIPSLSLEGCVLDGDLDVSSSCLTRLSLDRSQIREVVGYEVQVNGPLSLVGVRPLEDDGGVARIILGGGRVDGDVRLDKAHLRSDGAGDRFEPRPKAALELPNVLIDGKVSMRGILVEGGIRLIGARIMGDLILAKGRVARLKEPHPDCPPEFMNFNGATDAIYAHNMRVEGNCNMDYGFAAEGRVSFWGAHIDSDLVLDNAVLSGSSDDDEWWSDAFSGANLRVGGDLMLRGTTVKGCLRLWGATIGQNIECLGARIENPGKYAIRARSVTVGADVMFCHNHRKEDCPGFIAKGLIDLEDARIKGSLLFQRAALSEPRLMPEPGEIDVPESNGRPPDRAMAFSALGIRIEGVVRAAKLSVQGLFTLADAKIDGCVELEGASFSTPDYWAFSATSARIGTDVRLINSSFSGGAKINRADIGGEVEWRAITLGGQVIYPRNREKKHQEKPRARLSFRNTRIGMALKAHSLEAPDDAAINLSAASCAILDDNIDAGWGKRAEIQLDGFAYRALDNPIPGDSASDLLLRKAVGQRIAWLKRGFRGRLPGTPSRTKFRPQPFEQLTRVLRAAGDEAGARKIARKRKQYQALLHPRFPDLFSLVFGACFGFGMSTLRTMLTLFVFLMAGAWGVAHVNGSAGLMVIDATPVQASQTSGANLGMQAAAEVVDPPPCGDAINPVLYALDVAVPFIDLRQETECEIADPDSHPAQKAGSWRVGAAGVEGWRIEKASFWRVAKAVYALLGALLTALAIVTFSGVLRRESQE